MNKIILFLLSLIVISVLPFGVFADDPVFLKSGVNTKYISNANVTPATHQVTAGNVKIGWMLGISYKLINSTTAEIKVKDGSPSLASAELAQKSPLWQISGASESGYIEFNFPRWFVSWLVVEASGAIVNVEYVLEINRIRLPY